MAETQAFHMPQQKKKKKKWLLRNARKQADPQLLLGKLPSVAQRLTKRSLLAKSRTKPHDVPEIPTIKLIIWVKVLYFQVSFLKEQFKLTGRVKIPTALLWEMDPSQKVF